MHTYIIEGGFGKRRVGGELASEMRNATGEFANRTIMPPVTKPPL